MGGHFHGDMRVGHVRNRRGLHGTGCQLYEGTARQDETARTGRLETIPRGYACLETKPQELVVVHVKKLSRK